MGEEVLILLLVNQINRQGGSLQRRIILRNLRKKNNPFSLSERCFIKCFRIPKTFCRDIIEELHIYDNQSSSLPFHVRFLSVLNFLGNGSYQKCIGNNYTIALSQSSVSRCVQYICKLILRVKGNVTKFPTTNEEISVVLPTIGAVDCTHIAIVSPSVRDSITPAHLYMNRKGFYSINVEAVCNANLKFLHLNAKFLGSCHDSGNWTTSLVRMQLIRSHTCRQFKWLLGDSGYPLEPWIMTPVDGPTSQAELLYNQSHIRARNTIERAFGILKSRFRCLLKARVLHYSQERATHIIYACGILHNIMQTNGINLTYEDDNQTPEPLLAMETSDENQVSGRSQYYNEGRRVRQSYINTFNR